MSSGLLRDGAIYTAANVLSAGVPFLLLPVLTRALEPQEYGAVVNFFMLVSLCNALAGLGVHSAVSVKWFSREGEDFPAYVGAAVVLAMLSTALCSGALAFAALAFANDLGLARWCWPLAAVFAGSLAIIGVRTTLWQSQRMALRAAGLQVTNAVVNISLSLFAVFALALGGAGRIAGAVLASVLCAGAAIALLRSAGDMRWSTAWRDILKLLRFGLPLIPHTLAGALMASADRFSVAGGLGVEALGVYGAAAQLGMAMNILGDAMVKALSPWMYRQMASPSGAGRLRVVAATYLLVPIWLILALTLWGVFALAAPLLLDKRYLAAIDLVPFFLLGGAMSSIYLNIAGLYFFTSKTEWLSTATVLSSASALVLAPLMVAKFGLRGAAFAYFLIQALQLVLSWLLSTRVQPMPWARPGMALRVLARSWHRR